MEEITFLENCKQSSDRCVECLDTAKYNSTKHNLINETHPKTCFTSFFFSYALICHMKSPYNAMKSVGVK